MMKAQEQQILFKGPMIRAILEGRKTQTRRIVNPQPPAGCYYAINGNHDKACCLFEDNSMPGGLRCVPPTPTSSDHLLPCPYGRPGDRLWVRETWRTGKQLDHLSPSAIQHQAAEAGYTCNNGSIPAPIWYTADDEYRAFSHDRFGGPGKTRVSTHMPRWASRITLEITDIRCERLQGISEEDARAEGVDEICVLPGDRGSYVQPFAALWHEIYGQDSWSANPWVWVISFGQVK